MGSYPKDASQSDLLLHACATFRSNPQEGLDQIADLAQLGSVRAMIILGHLYLTGRSVVEKNDEKGEAYLKSAAALGSEEGLYRLARHYQSSLDFVSAEDAYTKLAEAGYAPAMNILAVAHYRGDWLSRDIPKALGLWQRAEAQGHIASKRWLSYVYRRDSLGLSKKMLGWIKTAQVCVLYPYYKIRHPDSERLIDW